MTTTNSVQISNLERIRQFLSVWDQRPLTPQHIDPYLSPGYVDRTRPPSDPQASDREVLIGLGMQVAAAFADGQHHIEVIEPVGEDRVLVFWRFTGTHSGTFFGIPASGRQVSFAGMDLLTLRDGMIVEHRHIEELLSAMAQLGALPPTS